jgi:hypothetical protein
MGIITSVECLLNLEKVLAVHYLEKRFHFLIWCFRSYFDLPVTSLLCWNMLMDGSHDQFRCNTSSVLAILLSCQISLFFLALSTSTHSIVLLCCTQCLKLIMETVTTNNKLHGLSPRANYTDRATAACRRNDCQLLWIEGATWSV